MNDYAWDLYVRVQGSPGRARNKVIHPPDCSWASGSLAQGSQAAGRKLQIWNVTVEHAGAWVTSERLWTGMATGKTESEFYLCFQTHKENQGQPKY